MLKRNFFTILFFGWMLVITISSLFSLNMGGTGGINIPHLDKIVHMVFYLVVVVLGFAYLSERNQRALNVSKSVVVLVLFAIAYGILMEVLQALMPFQRMAEFYDVLANTLGALLGGLLTQKYHSRIVKLK